MEGRARASRKCESSGPNRREERPSKSGGAKGGFPPFASGEYSRASEATSALKKTVGPHDLIAVDVFAALLKDNRVNRDLLSTRHGGLFLVEGTLVLVDRHMMRLAASAIQMATGQADPDSRALMQGIAVFMNDLAIPSSALLLTTDGHKVAGTIKDEGLEEPISSYYFKHGTGGVSGIFMLGIREVTTPVTNLPGTAILGSSQKAAQALSEMLFPQDALRVTPLALFRKL
jgi:hypothetical protein